MPEHIDYDAEPVEYCKRCYSLRIRYEEAIDACCCMDCGSTETGTTDIRTWERMYRDRYGHSFLECKDTPRESPYFKMSIDRLKTLLYNDRNLPAILHQLYHGFPKGLSRSESVILLFDKLSKDNRIDDLRYLYYMKSKNHIKV